MPMLSVKASFGLPVDFGERRGITIQHAHMRAAPKLTIGCNWS